MERTPYSPAASWTWFQMLFTRIVPRPDGECPASRALLQEFHRYSPCDREALDLALLAACAVEMIRRVPGNSALNDAAGLMRRAPRAKMPAAMRILELLSSEAPILDVARTAGALAAQAS